MRDRDRAGGRKRPIELFITGLITTAVCGLLMRLHIIPHFPSWVFGFPMVFGGILPMMRGLSGMVRGGVGRVIDARTEQQAIQPPDLSQADLKTEAERKILMLARSEGGVVTPAMVALKTDLSLDKAGEVLDDLARRGYAGMQVKEDGRVVYSFPEFERPENEGTGP
jgi:hypothetical protein